jgi:3-oxoacyl-[acyl-carrier-protein] synthase-1
LAQAIEDVLTNLSHRINKLSFIIGDLNGDTHRSSEWGYALVRLQDRFRLGNLPLWLPSVSFGETGAAAGAIAVCIATKAFERRYAPGNIALVWLLSENGSRGAFCLNALSD